MIGTRLKGIYRLIEEKEHSDLMTLYLAEDESSGSLVDIKVINPGLGDDDKFLKQFQREAQALSFVSSPHIIRLVELFTRATATPSLDKSHKFNIVNAENAVLKEKFTDAIRMMPENKAKETIDVRKNLVLSELRALNEV